MRFFLAFVASLTVMVAGYQTLYPRLIPVQPDLNWVFELEQNKWAAAEAVDPPRILIIGGSEAHYGLSAEIFSRETGLPAFNLGTHAGLSWHTHIRTTESLMKPGDIIVFSVNYSLLIHDDLRAMDVRYWRYKNPGHFTKFPVWDWPVFWGGDLLGDILEIPSYSRAMGWLRRANAITPQGDATQNVIRKPRTEKQNRQLIHSGASPAYEGDAPGLQQILALRDYARKHGARFYVVFPGQLDHPKYHQAPKYKGNFEAIDTLFSQNDIESLNRMDQALLPVEFMYDTIYHPTDAGRTRISTPAAKALARKLEADGVITKNMESPS